MCSLPVYGNGLTFASCIAQYTCDNDVITPRSPLPL